MEGREPARMTIVNGFAGSSSLPWLDKGHSLIEICVAMLLLAAAVIGNGGLSMRILDHFQESHQRNLAVIHATTISELIRNRGEGPSAGVCTSFPNCRESWIDSEGIPVWQAELRSILPYSRNQLVDNGKFIIVNITWQDHIRYRGEGQPEVSCSLQPEMVNCHTLMVRK